LLSAKDAPDLIETLSQTIDSLSSVEAAIPVHSAIRESHGMEVAFPLLLVKKMMMMMMMMMVMMMIMMMMLEPVSFPMKFQKKGRLKKG